MAELPTGIVTFLFTDIEGSTELVGALGDRYPPLLERHHELLRAAFAEHAGFERGTEGDAFFVVFGSPAAAVRAAAAAQRSLEAEAWPEGSPVRVRMGLHTGEGRLGGDDYVGLDVHRASRIASAGHGGQVLLSDATRALVEAALPSGVGLVDLGEHRLKGLPRPERIFQLAIDGLASSFPALRSLDVRPNNLPSEMSTFIGRERQIREVREGLRSTRVLTLTGPGGTGKTRLALRVAEEVLTDFEHGCWFVPLDTIRDPELVPAAIAGAVRARLAGDRPVVDSLVSWIAERELLLVLDNFEQVGGAATLVARLLDAAPRVRVLATSRTPLHLYGEHEYPVPTLSLGAGLGSGAKPSAESLSQYEAVRLFIERALAVRPDFRVTNANAPAVAEICARLDGLPLAIELAAARIKLLGPEQMLARLEDSLALLSTASRDLPERQRTLIGAIGWSYDLLGDAERRLFARLSIFRGGFSLDAAEEVCGGEGLGIDVLDGLAALVDWSLLTSDEVGAEARFTMLGTLRDFARERLVASGELPALVERHAAYFFRLAAEAEPNLIGADQLAWLDRLDREHDNLRAAFDRVPGAGSVDTAVAAAGAIWRYWQLRGHFGEARSTLERLLSLPGAGDWARAKALGGAGSIAYWQGDFEAMARHYAEARQLAETNADLVLLGGALYNESYVPLLRDGDLAATRALLERARDAYRRAGHIIGIADAESMMGFGHYFHGALEEAISYQEQAVEAYRAAGATWQLAENLSGLSGMYAQAGQWTRANALMRESLSIMKALDSEVGLGMQFVMIGAAAAWSGDPERGARLLGKADEMQERLGGGAPRQFASNDAAIAKARADLGDERFEALRAEGRALSTADAIALVEGFDPPADAPPMPRLQPWGATARDE